MNNPPEDSQYFKNLKASGAFKEFMNRRTRKKFYVDHNAEMLNTETKLYMDNQEMPMKPQFTKKNLSV